jgi:hypothetical protein
MKKYGLSQAQNPNFQPYEPLTRERINDLPVCPDAARQARKQAYEQQRKNVTQLDFRLLWGPEIVSKGLKP